MQSRLNIKKNNKSILIKDKTLNDEAQEEQIIEAICAYHSPEWGQKYRIINNYAPCEFKKAELVEQLDQEEEFENLLKSQGLSTLRNKFLEENA